MKTQINKSIMIVIVSLLFVFTLMGCQQAPTTQSENKSTTPSGKISVSGAFALYPMMVRWAEEYQKINPNIQIDVSAGGAGKGMSDTIAGMVDIGMVSRDVKPEEVTQGAFAITVTKDAVFPVVNEQNPVVKDILKSGVSKETFGGIYINKDITSWGQVVSNNNVTDQIHIYTRSDACGAADVWSGFLGGKQENLAGIGVSGDPGISEAVVKDSLGIGYNNLNYAFDPSSGKPVKGLVVVPIDINGNGTVDPSELIDTKEKAIQAVASGQYPEPPARYLFLVTKGVPSGVTRDFILWILGDGQKYINEVGYVNITAGKLTEEIAKLK